MPSNDFAELLLVLLTDVQAQRVHLTALHVEARRLKLARALNAKERIGAYASSLSKQQTAAFRFWLAAEIARPVPPPAYGDDTEAWALVREALQRWHDGL